MEHFNLETFAGGALSQQINRAIEEVAQNIQNPNTDAKAVRKITVTISFKSNDQRDFVTTGVQTNTKLAPTLGGSHSYGNGQRSENWGRPSGRDWKPDPWAAGACPARSI